MTTQMERVEDVMSYPSDPIFEPKEKKAEFQKLTGEIEMKDVSFGYSKFDPPLIRNLIIPGLRPTPAAVQHSWTALQPI